MSVFFRPGSFEARDQPTPAIHVCRRRDGGNRYAPSRQEEVGGRRWRYRVKVGAVVCYRLTSLRCSAVILLLALLYMHAIANHQPRLEIVPNSRKEIFMTHRYHTHIHTQNANMSFVTMPMWSRWDFFFFLFISSYW